MERSPEAVALVFDRTALSYRQLATEASRLARRLRRLGVGPEVPVGICLERSFDLVVGLLAILEAGGAYVPLDPSYPRERLAGMLEDAGAPVVLTWHWLVEALPAHGGRTVFLDDPADPTPEPELAPAQVGLDNLAYVIFTSGSTGRPKGAMNSHRGIVNRLLWMQETYRLTAADRVLQKTPFSFDVSVWELFWPLLSGACLVVARPGEHQEPARLARTIVEESVTTLHFVPAMLQAFLEEPAAARCGSVRQVMASGEALPAALQERFFERLPGAALHNLYGPTEAAVDVTFWACEPGSARAAVPIGRPVANTAIHLLDAGFEPVPVGVPGELSIGGVQVGRGYFGRPELTAERFVPAPAGEPGGRLYRTGDLVRRLPAGEVEFLGRIDHQVKIRGLRIELGEIESALARHPGVQEAVVLAAAGPSGDAADRRLVAYLVPEALRSAPLRARLRLEREGHLTAGDLHELPNGMAVAHRNRGETEFLYREIFVDEGYLRHGIAVADGDTIFDVGANIGLFALFAGRRAAGVRVYAFEPIPEVFAALSMNAALHGLDARLFDCGLAEAPGTAEFTYYPHATLISGRFADGAEEREVVRSFVRSQAESEEAGEGLAADRLEELLTERLEARRVTCRLRTLSEVIAAEAVERIDLLKIDVEKSELAVLAGLGEEDWRKVRQVVLEVHDVEGRLAQVLALLERHGFAVAAEQDLELSGTALYNLYARRPAAPGETRAATPPEPAWESAGQLIADVTAALQAELPEFMVPTAFSVLESFPLSPSGKVDRRALAGYGSSATAVQGARTAPSRPMEKLLAGVWAELLRLDPEAIGTADNFFALGGHSLLGARLLSRLSSRLGIELPLRRLFTTPVLADLAREMEAAVEAAGAARSTAVPCGAAAAPGGAAALLLPGAAVVPGSARTGERGLQRAGFSPSARRASPGRACGRAPRDRAAPRGAADDLRPRRGPAGPGDRGRAPGRNAGGRPRRSSRAVATGDGRRAHPRRGAAPVRPRRRSSAPGSPGTARGERTCRARGAPEPAPHRFGRLVDGGADRGARGALHRLPRQGGLAAPGAPAGSMRTTRSGNGSSSPGRSWSASSAGGGSSSPGRRRRWSCRPTGRARRCRASAAPGCLRLRPQPRRGGPAALPRNRERASS